MRPVEHPTGAERPGSSASGAGGTSEGYGGENLGTDPVGVGGSQMDADSPAEGVAGHDNRLGHLVEDRRRGGGVLGRAPCRRWGGRGAEAR